jgi:hypothetical protein
LNVEGFRLKPRDEAHKWQLRIVTAVPKNNNHPRCHHEQNSCPMSFFPNHHGEWKRAHKELFFLFVRILLQHLKVTKAEELRRVVKDTISQLACLLVQEQQQQSNAFFTGGSRSTPAALSTTTTTTNVVSLCDNQSCDSSSITAILYDQLRDVVPNETWQQSESYLYQYLLVRLRQQQQQNKSNNPPKRARRDDDEQTRETTIILNDDD